MERGGVRWKWRRWGEGYNCVWYEVFFFLLLVVLSSAGGGDDCR